MMKVKCLGFSLLMGLAIVSSAPSQEDNDLNNIRQKRSLHYLYPRKFDYPTPRGPFSYVLIKLFGLFSSATSTDTSDLDSSSPPTSTDNIPRLHSLT